MKGLGRIAALGLALVMSGVAPLVAATQDPPPPPQKAPIRVGGAVKPPERIKHVEPVYPDIARQAKIQGVVIIEAIVGKDGSVTAAKVLKPLPLLDEAALQAVKQWKYEKPYVDGEAVDVIMIVTVSFSLK